ncbi:hypothetical protein BX616_010657, partial [Lobosporangium transversale]
MEFSFTATPSTIPTVAPTGVTSPEQFAGISSGTQQPNCLPSTFTFTTSNSKMIATEAAITGQQTNQFQSLFQPQSQNQYDRVSVKKEYGIGDTSQWRKRLITQIEDRIKDKRISIHNARRSGLQQPQNLGANQSSHDNNHSYSPDIALSSAYSAKAAGSVPATTATTVAPTTFAIIGESGEDTTAFDVEEERQRIVAEVWETFKSENYEELYEAFRGMTDVEIEEIEQDILKYRYSTGYDPTYDMVTDMEDQGMDETIEHYMWLESSLKADPQGDPDVMAALSLSVTLLSGTTCVQCHHGLIVFEPTVSSDPISNQSKGLRASCAAACGFYLEKEALLYFANAARSH